MEDEERLKELVEQAVANAIAPFIQPKQTLLISRDAAAKRLRVTVATLCRWAKSGYLPVSARLGRNVYYSEESIRRLEAGERLSQAVLPSVKRSMSPYPRKS